MVGTPRDKEHSIDLAIASACPLSSAPTPGYAPGVSINIMTGKPNLSAIFINLIDLRYPSGLIIPKFLSILVLRSSPFSCPITKTELFSKFARPAIEDLSSPNNLSPERGKKLSKRLSIKNFDFGLSSCLATIVVCHGSSFE